MKNLKEVVAHDLRRAMVEKEGWKKDVLRQVKVRVDSFEKEHGDTATDKVWYSSINTELKQLNQTLDYAKKAGNSTVELDCSVKMDYLNSLLPAQMSDDELKAFVEQHINPANGIGGNIKDISNLAEGMADAKRIHQAVKEILSK